MRKFSKSILTVSLLSPLSAYALGIGDITTNSALNQVLRAEIPLVGSQSEDPSNIRVSLASPAAFEKAGMDRPFYLSTLKFNPVINANGSITVKVTSEDRIKEPFVNFLLEVQWPKGTTMREFTILLDPPVTMPSQTTPVQTTAVTPSSNESSPIAASASYQQGNNRVAQAMPDSYGPVKKNDNLWRIAGDLIASNDISREQMMLALYDENPQAFYKKNVNALKRGAILSVPERETIVRRSVKQAKSQFKEQNRIWTSASKSTPPATSAPATSESADVGSSPSQANVTKTVAAVDPDTQGQLKLMTPKEGNTQAENIPVEGGSIDTPVGSTEPSVQANMAMEMAASLEQENKEFQNRLASLESQVEKLQNQIALKDAELAKLEASKPAPQATPAAAESESSNLPWYAGGALIVLLLAWLLGRRRSSDQTLPEPERAPAPSASQDTERLIEDDGQPLRSVASDTPPESTLLSEFTASEFDEFGDHEQTADPLTETDVYIAYGRYQQAEDLMLNALEQEPDNSAYQLKLMDIFFAAGKSKEFESYARDLQSLQRQDPELWSQISTMGQELCPDSPLFGDDNNSQNRDEPEPTDDLTDLDSELDEDLEAPLVIDTDNTVEDELAAFEDSIETTKTSPNSDDAETLVAEKPDNKDDFEFDFELIQPTEETHSSEESGEADEATTKLALVEAYIDMEDLEAARETLNEVLEVGNEEQKAQAQKMLDNL